MGFFDKDESFECDPSNCGDCGGCEGIREEFPSTITLTMEDDSVVECAVISIYPVEDKQYIALVPVDESGEVAEAEVYIYAFRLTEEGAPVLSNIVDDDEYEAASRAFDEIMENAELVAEADPE